MKDIKQIIQMSLICTTSIVMILVLIGLITNITFCRMYSPDFIISVLSLLVTILIGWQIYTIINIDKKIAEHIKDINKQIREDIKYNSNTFTLVCLAQTAKALHHLEKYEESIPLMFNAISSIEISTAKPSREEAYNFCINNLMEICPKVTELEVTSEEEKDFFIRTALQTKKQEIIDFAFKIKIKSDRETNPNNIENQL